MFREGPSRPRSAAGLIAAFTLIFIALLLAGCGGTTKPASPTAQPAPSPQPTPAPQPTPTSQSTPPPQPTPAPSPIPANAPDSYLAQIVDDIPKVPALVGQVTIDTSANNGTGTVQLTGGATNTTMVLQFCPYPQQLQNCVNVTSFTTDLRGLASVNFTFPLKGAFSGMFQLACSGEQCLTTGTGSSGVNFKAAELPAASITGGINQTTGNAPGIGSVQVNGTMAHLVLSGTTPNHTFSVAICSMFLSTPCSALSSVTTDAQGNVSADVGNVQPAGWNVFTVSDGSGVEFVTGFRVQ